MPQWFQRAFMHNGSLKLIAFVLTLALFIWVREDRESAVTGYVAVRLVIPEKMVLVSNPVEKVRITVGGRWSDLTKFDPSQLPPITLHVDSETNGLVSISSDLIKTPPGLHVTAIQPNYVRVKLEPAAKKMLPIRPRIVGEPGDSFVLGDVKVRPPRIEVTGPKSSVDDLEYVWTEPIDVTDRTESYEKRVQLRLDDPLLQYDVDKVITVSVPIETQEVTRTLQGVSVIGVNTTYKASIRPSSVTVTIRGPKPIVDRLKPDSLYAAIDLTDENQKPPGTFSRQARIANLPPDVTLVAFHPNEFLVTTKRASNPPPQNPTPKHAPQRKPAKKAPARKTPAKKPAPAPQHP